MAPPGIPLNFSPNVHLMCSVVVDTDGQQLNPTAQSGLMYTGGGETPAIVPMRIETLGTD